jgi:catechol 2,3-dioxygenase-like lactoylglutathione lyase family enzyme
MTILAIDHVQLAMPSGGEAQARAFYGQLLGLPELPKPPSLSGRGGVWFGNGAVQIHLGVEPDFRPPRKAHPALRVEDLDALETALRAGGFEPERDTGLPGYARFYVADPFDNRLEFLETQPREASGQE